MDSLKLPKGSSASSSASGSNSNLSGSASTSVVGSLATSPTTAVPATVAGTGTVKTPPGLSSSTPISVRFNANEESLDDILQSFHHNAQQQHSHSPSGGSVGVGVGVGGAGDVSPTATLLGIKNNGSVGAALGMMVNACDSHSLSSSPSQQQQQQQHLQQQQQAAAAAAVSLFNDDMRNNYLQSAGGSVGTGTVGGGTGSGGYFNRKRSGSIEGVSPTSSGPNLLTALSGSVTAAAAAAGGVSGVITPGIDNNSATVGTWKLIKGKVSQTIEEIKSSKHHTQPTSAVPVIVADASSISTVGWTNEPDSDTECITINTSYSEELAHTQHNSDSDAEAEQLQHDSSSLGSGEVAASAAISTERSRLRRGLAHIKSKVKAKQQAACMNKKEVGSSSIAPVTLRSGFLRRRHQADANVEPSTSGQAEARDARDSGSSAEIPVASGKAKRGIMLARKDVEIESGVEVYEDMTALSHDEPTEHTEQAAAVEQEDCGSLTERASLNLPLEKMSTVSLLSGDSDSVSKKSLFGQSKSAVWKTFSTASVANWRAHAAAQPALLIMVLIVLTTLPLPAFVRGVLATVTFMMVMNSTSDYFRYLWEKYMLKERPERIPFKIPDYSSMPICEIPAVEEHKTVKTYAGWLNEINSYDHNTFSFTMTRSVYVRLDGTVLKLSGTNARIPKRRMWNELPIDRTKVLFTDHRSYDLRNSRIELLPVGLAKKRFFNRKYPIQLIIKNNDFSSPTHSKDSNLVATPSSVNDDDGKTVDFASTVLQADLQQLRNQVNPDVGLQDITIPCGDEVRLLLFTRCDREKEDWYRRFLAASKGSVHEQDLQVPMIRFVDEADLQAAAAQNAITMLMSANKLKVKEGEERSVGNNDQSVADETNSNTPDTQFEEIQEEDCTPDDIKDSYEGLIMNADVARNPADYVKFMTVYQARRAKRQEDELWKGIDQSLFLGPSGSVVWANVLMGRCLFSLLHDTLLHEKIKDFMQKKLNSIKLPSFMEDVIITNIYLGKLPMLFHRISQPMLDERGIWLDADVTYEGLAHITLTTKLNLLRVRSKPRAPTLFTDSATHSTQEIMPETRSMNEDVAADGNSAIYDSDAESSGGSSTESESPNPTAAVDPAGNSEFFQNSPGNARRIFKIVDRIATSNLFQYATELPYVQRAMENMSTNITLRVDLKGLVARGTLNIPPPPSDRVWMCFRGPPRLWISTKPQVGDKSVDWSIVTNVIESKLCEAVNKYLVYPNMVDFNIPFLGNPSYEDEPPGPSN